MAALQASHLVETEAIRLQITCWRLRKHADYQRAYKASRKQFSPSMTYFYAPQPAWQGDQPARVGLTAGKVVGNAVVRNRIKRRMREVIRYNLHLLPPKTDVILHPRKSILEMEFAELRLEVERIFRKIGNVKTAERNSAEKTAKPA